MSGLVDKIDTLSSPEYNEVNIILGGGNVTVADIIRDALKAKNWSQRELAAKMGWSPQNLSGRLKNNSLSAEEWRKVAAILGFEIKMVEIDSNEELKTRKRGIGPRVRQMVNGVIYDTYKADALCHTLWTDGWFMELYRDGEGRYFVAHYTDWKNGVNHISPCSIEDARRLYEQYGEDGDADSVFGVA